MHTQNREADHRHQQYWQSEGGGRAVSDKKIADCLEQLIPGHQDRSKAQHSRELQIRIEPSG